MATSPSFQYDFLINGLSLVGILIFVIWTLRKFGMNHEGVMVAVAFLVSGLFIFGEEYLPHITGDVAEMAAVTATVTIGFTGLKNTVFKKGVGVDGSNVVNPPVNPSPAGSPKPAPAATKKLPDNLF